MSRESKHRRCKDYTVFLETMERIDRVLIDSSLEREAIVKALKDGMKREGRIGSDAL